MTATLCSASARRVAVSITPMETRHDVILRLATRAEALGYHAFLLAEGWGHDATVLLGALAARTRWIRIGTGVLNVWGRSAAGMAMLAGSLDAVSGGRFILGLGAGSPQLAEGLHDQPFTAPVDRLAAVTRQVRALLAGERMTPTRAGSVRPLRLAVGPNPDIPLFLAALGPEAVRLTGELADGWFPFLLPRSGLQDGIERLGDGAAAAGRPRPLVSPGVPVALAENPADAHAVACWWVSTYLTGMGPVYPRTLRRLGFDAAVDSVLAANPTPRMSAVPKAARVLLDELTVWGDAEAGRERLDHWFEAGAELPAVVLPPGRPVAELEYALEALAPVAGESRRVRPRSSVNLRAAGGFDR